MSSLAFWWHVQYNNVAGERLCRNVVIEIVFLNHNSQGGVYVVVTVEGESR